MCIKLITIIYRFDNHDDDEDVYHVDGGGNIDFNKLTLFIAIHISCHNLRYFNTIDVLICID